ncbi:DinB family protein [Bacillus chungangensis]|uniref:Damage-inducible protein DinB n=1 Tax=Bacillus chungangensis TaxID=587633 RepID=A0ABT9WXU3_9BACI|nr:DinB family protein [Bacillus chungangensis]MDQ0178119.1 putative damage-inducible protein DinB [Bacillus chungangensis]
MLTELFQYNWQIRDEWMQWCREISYEELVKKRIGGMGSFLHTLFHVIDCEQLWVNQMWGKSVIVKDIETIKSLDDVKLYASATCANTMLFLDEHRENFEDKTLLIKTRNGDKLILPHKKILQHIITHEVHHIGQLSIWARELGVAPVHSDLLTRDL